MSSQCAKRDLPGGASGKEPTCRCRRREIRVLSLSQEDSLEEGMTSHSSILAGTEEPGGLWFIGSQRG